MGYKPIIYSDESLSLPEFNWRVSVSLDTFNFTDTTPFKVFWQVEPPEIKREAFFKLKKNWEFYDLILTWNHELLSECGHTKLFPCGSPWVINGDTSAKTFSTSYLTSSKTMCPGHLYRQEIFANLPGQIGNLPIKKHRSPPHLPDKNVMLAPFQFTIVLENARRPNYFTEKIIDAFATKTIPLYWGCPNIGDFFNKEGVIFFDTYENLINTLERLTPDDYHKRVAAIEENYNKSLAYQNLTDRLVGAINDGLAGKR